MILYNSDLKIFSSTLINDNSYFSGYSNKSLGDARQVENIMNFFTNNSVNYSSLVILSQIHSTNIDILRDHKTAEKIMNIEDTDGVITRIKGVILSIRNADCLPLLFVDKTTGYIGISHQGWRGSLKKMVIKMVDTFLSLGSRIGDLKCSLGPAIGSCCYDIDDERYFSFLEEFNGYSDKIFSRNKGRWHLNLSLLNYLQLISIGVKKEHIDFFPFCTKCDKNRFFSRRRSKSNDFAEMFNFVMKV